MTKKIIGILLLILVSIIFLSENNDFELKKVLITDKNIDIEDLYEIKEPIKEINNEIHVTFNTLNEGYDVYAPSSMGYRYGPSIIKNEDGTIDMWMASNGNKSEWDFITYRHFDGEWSKEKIVLTPSKNTADHYSVCDPGVIYFNGYYYLGYTSTIVSKNNGINNNVFVARSKNPDGPFEKWDGSGWGKDPYPIIYYDEDEDYWGAGEVSFVIKDEELYIYYSWICPHGNYTKLSKSDLSENWPLNMEEVGIVFAHNTEDSIDVAYLEEYDKFIAITVKNRFSNDSGIEILESKDGTKFYIADFIRTKVAAYSHNSGVSKDLNGHITVGENLVSYAYGTKWGKWALRMQDINLNVYMGDKYYHDGYASPSIRYFSKHQYEDLIGIEVTDKYIDLKIGEKEKIKLIGYDSNLRSSSLNGNFILADYDEEIIKVSGDTIIGLNSGSTYVNAYYGDFYTTFKVVVDLDDDIVDFVPIKDEYILDFDDIHLKQVISLLKYEDGTYKEISEEAYYEALDENIIKVENGFIYPLKTGRTILYVKYENIVKEIKIVVHK